MVIVVMGVCGCGKSTVGALVAARLGCPFRDGDGFHPPENVAKMSQGIPLTDADRAPWLERIRAYMQSCLDAGTNAVIACSALKAAYRKTLLCGQPGVLFVHLHGSKELLQSRMSARTGHFMPASLLESQLATLEMPAPDEALILDIIHPPEELAERVMNRIQG